MKNLERVAAITGKIYLLAMLYAIGVSLICNQILLPIGLFDEYTEFRLIFAITISFFVGKNTK
jgi:hypothetical protein